MSLMSALYDHLKNDAAVAAVVGDRIYPQQADASAISPYLTLNMLARPHEQHQGGMAGLARATMQIDCWALDYDEVESASDAVRLRLDMFRGDMGTENLTVRGTLLLDDSDGLVDPSHGSQEGIHRRMMEFHIWHTESTS